MSDAPAWLVDVVFDALPLLSPLDDAPTVAVEISSAVWAEVEKRFSDTYCTEDYHRLIDALEEDEDESPRFRTLSGELVIPSRTTDPATSHAAAREIKIKAGSQRARLLQAFAEEPEFRRAMGWADLDGMTDEEAMEAAKGVYERSEYSKRCSELREAGYIEPTGETRTGSSGLQRIVSRITDKGRRAVREL